MEEHHGGARRTLLRPVTRDTPRELEFLRVVCPYPLIRSGIVNAVQTIVHGHAQGTAAGKCRVVLLWVESSRELPDSVAGAREEDSNAMVVVLGLRGELSMAWAALQAGARGYVHAEMQPDQVARAILVAARGEVVFPRDLISYLASQSVSQPPGDATLASLPERGELRPRQREVLELVVEGLSNAEIAKRLYLSESTVKQHLRGAYKILGVGNRTEAAKYIREGGGLPRNA